MVFPEGQVPWTSYSFAIHTIHNLPWSVLITEDSQLSLVASECSGRAVYEKKSLNPMPCLACRLLHNHSVIMGMRHRLLDGPKNKSRYAYLSIADLWQSLDDKNEQIVTLRHRGLNAGRAIAVRNKRLNGWNRLAVAISESNVARIQIIFRVELRNGAGIFGLLNKVVSASSSNYRPLSYEESNYQQAYLMWKLGGRSAANIAHRTMGCPSIDSARRHVATKPLWTSAGVPKLAEIKANLAIGFENQPVDYTKTIGMTMPVDEIKLQERLRWDSRTNHILGICREHGDICSLEFRTITEADWIVDCLNSSRVHFSSEVRM